jgi:hypothetical protein
MKIFSRAALATILAASTFTADAQQGSVSQSAANGLNTVTFDTAAGKIKVYLPEDMRPGDTISGTVTAEPRGSTDTERTANSGVLNGMVIDTDGENRSSVGQKSFTWKIRAGQAISALKRQLRLYSAGAARSPTHVATLALSSVTQTPPTDFVLPRLGQAGRPLTIFGPFDGNAANTASRLGDRPLEILAESQRQASFRSPADMTGPAELSVTESGHTGSGQFRNVGVSLASPKTNLVRNEKTPLTVDVSGLDGITTNVPLLLATMGTASMSGGNAQTIEIRPMDVNSSGHYNRTFELTGTQTGGFTVIATILSDNPAAGGSCKCVCELAKTPIVTAGTSKIDGGGMQHVFKANVAKAACNGDKCSVEKTEYSWSIGGASTATYTVAGARQNGEALKLDVTGAGTVVLTVTVTITCSDRSTCSATGTKTFRVDAK